MRLWFNRIFSAVMILTSSQPVLLFFVFDLVHMPKGLLLGSTYMNCCEQGQRSGLVIRFIAQLHKQFGRFEGPMLL